MADPDRAVRELERLQLENASLLRAAEAMAPLVRHMQMTITELSSVRNRLRSATDAWADELRKGLGTNTLAEKIKNI